MPLPLLASQGEGGLVVSCIVFEESICRMIIASPEFPLVFLPFLAVYWSLRRFVHWQKIALLVFGYLIYGTVSMVFAATLAAFSCFIWLVSMAVYRDSELFRKSILFWIGVAGALGLLGFFKYFNFFGQQAAALIQLLGLQWAVPVVDILMPLGISFYVFQAIAYLYAVRYQSFEVASLPDLSLYLCFLPTLVAGPICRPSGLLRQISSVVPRACGDLNEVLLLIASFVIKKVWLASWLAQDVVDPVFADPLAFNGAELLLAAASYALQIFFDFSGYTDLAVAAALMLGYRLPDNFNLPYLAASLSEFWGRWHISLSGWIRDFIYIPLGGSRVGFLRMLSNLMVAMTLSGLWHGASPKYVVWGVFHGFCLCAEKLLKRFKVERIGLLPTFVLVCIGWVFFRSPTLSASLSYLGACTDWRAPLNPELPHLAVALLIPSCFLVWFNAGKICLAARCWFDGIPAVVRPIPVALIITLALGLSPEGMPNFIYAQF